MRDWVFTIPGRPRTWQRTNQVKGRRVTDAKQREAKRRIAWLALATRPKGWSMDRDDYDVSVRGYWPDRRYGDVDRLVSLVLDGLEGVAYREDRQVQAEHGWRGLDKGNPRTEVVVTLLAACDNARDALEEGDL